jgi:Universal stress protein family
VTRPRSWRTPPDPHRRAGDPERGGWLAAGDHCRSPVVCRAPLKRWSLVVRARTRLQRRHGVRREAGQRWLTLRTGGSRGRLELAKEHGADVTFVHVTPAEEIRGGRGGAHALTQREEIDESESALKDAGAAAEAAGVSSALERFAGETVETIVALADSKDADMIVLGDRGRSAATAALLGSVSQRGFTTPSGRCSSSRPRRQRRRRPSCWRLVAGGALASHGQACLFTGRQTGPTKPPRRSSVGRGNPSGSHLRTDRLDGQPAVLAAQTGQAECGRENAKRDLLGALKRECPNPDR